MTARDQTHLNRLTTLYRIAGVLVVLFGLVFLGHVYIGWQMIHSSGFDQQFSSSEEAEAVGGLFVLGGVMAIGTLWMFGALLLLTARILSRRQYRTLCLVVSGVNCALFPFGTALGVYGILTLTRPGVEEAFR